VGWPVDRSSSVILKTIGPKTSGRQGECFRTRVFMSCLSTERLYEYTHIPSYSDYYIDCTYLTKFLVRVLYYVSYRRQQAFVIV
jgi:hypothetical protein